MFRLFVPRLYTIAGGLVLAGGLSLIYASRRRRKTPEQRERERRDYLHQVGRIIDGTVIDVAEMEQGGRAVQLLIYSYDVAGVQYEASQDITHLRQLVDLHTCRIGLPASIKYDPQNPGNSIVICEGWSGLRTGRLFTSPAEQQAAAQKLPASEKPAERTEEHARTQRG